MRTILVIGMLLIVAVGWAWEIRDVNGVIRSTAGRNVIIVIGNTNCPPLDNMIRFQLAGLITDYPDVLAMAVFPCTNSAPAAVRAWQARVPGASNFCPIEIDARTIHPLLTEWQNMGYPQYGGFLYSQSGICVTNWNYWRDRHSVEVPLTRQLNNLTISRGQNGPVVSFRKTGIPWRLEKHSGPVTMYNLVYP